MEPFIKKLIDEALSDPNLTNEERERIDTIQLNAMNRANDVFMSKEDRREYTKALNEELKKHEAEILSIRGRAANRESRRIEEF